MSDRSPRYWHGGVPDLRPGDLIEPRPCEARRQGQQLDGDDNDPTLVYVTTDREYARLYAAGYPRGALYQVEPVGELVDRTHAGHDPVPSWGVPAARVLVVYDAVVTLSPAQFRRMSKRWAEVTA